MLQEDSDQDGDELGIVPIFFCCFIFVFLLTWGSDWAAGLEATADFVEFVFFPRWNITKLSTLLYVFTS